MPGLSLKIVDHLVYATPDLETSIDDLETRLGVRAAYGGSHPGRGTRNALIALSELSYLEIVAPDPAQARDSRVGSPRWFGIDTLDGPRLVTWAAKTSSIDEAVGEALRHSVALGRVIAGARQTAAGEMLRWRFTDPTVVIDDGLVPFVIDWGTSPHPASSAPRGATLVSLSAEHPEPARIERALMAVCAPMQVQIAPQPALVATVRGARGDVELR